LMISANPPARHGRSYDGRGHHMRPQVGCRMLRGVSLKKRYSRAGPLRGFRTWFNATKGGLSAAGVHAIFRDFGIPRLPQKIVGEYIARSETAAHPLVTYVTDPSVDQHWGDGEPRDYTNDDVDDTVCLEGSCDEDAVTDDEDGDVGEEQAGECKGDLSPVLSLYSTHTIK